MSQDAAFKEGVQRILGDLRQVGAGRVFGPGEDGRSVPLQEARSRDLFWAVQRVVDRGAIRRPLGLPADGLHARLAK